MTLGNVENIVLVLSGKGGVGKSSVTTQLALSLALKGKSVGVLDIDLTGPSIPRFFGIEEERVRQAPGGWIPVTVHEARLSQEKALQASQATNGAPRDGYATANDGTTLGALSCMSLGFVLSSRSDAVVWRGPKKTAMVRQFLDSVLWPPGLDYLLIDTPPGTSDEHISLLETLLKTTTPEQLAGAVVVTTPQAISISDVKKELNFCKKVGIYVLGVVENMAGYVCPNCMECTHVFSKGGGRIMADEFGCSFLGSLPIDPAFVSLIEDGTTPVYPRGTVVAGHPLVESEHDSASRPEKQSAPRLLVDKYRLCSLFPLMDDIVTQIVAEISRRKRPTQIQAV